MVPRFHNSWDLFVVSQCVGGKENIVRSPFAFYLIYFALSLSACAYAMLFGTFRNACSACRMARRACVWVVVFVFSGHAAAALALMKSLVAETRECHSRATAASSLRNIKRFHSSKTFWGNISISWKSYECHLSWSMCAYSCMCVWMCVCVCALSCVCNVISSAFVYLEHMLSRLKLCGFLRCFHYKSKYNSISALIWSARRAGQHSSRPHFVNIVWYTDGIIYLA